MTAQENNLLRELLEKKIQEYTAAIHELELMCEADDLQDEIEPSTRFLRAARRKAWEFQHELRQTDSNWAELTIEHLRECVEL